MSNGRRSTPSRGAKWTTGKDGCIRFNRDFSRIGVGRIARSSRTRDEREFQRRNSILTKLADDGQVDGLRAFRNGTVTIEQLVDADRRGCLRSADLLALLTLARPLWSTIIATLPAMGAGESTRKRYTVSLDALRTKASAYLGEGARIEALRLVSWNELRAVWGRSPSDWNHMRRALSRFLSIALGDKYHSFRRSVIERIPIASEVGRVPDVTPEVFWRIIAEVPKPYQACFIALVATGMRVGEYLRCTRFNLKPATFQVIVPGTKTAGSADAVVVHEDFWRYVETAIPAPIHYKALRKHWTNACKKIGVDARIHDLRHCYGQWGVDAGVSESKVQSGLRHKTASMTRRYTRTREKGDAARAVGNALLAGRPKETAAQIAAQGGDHE